MTRTRIAALALLACAALAAAGVAAASHRRSQSTQQAAATFAATDVAKAKTRMCTGSDGTYAETTATYTGASSSSDPRLAGPLTIRAHSVVDTATGLGWLAGSFRVRGADGEAHGRLTAAISGGHAVGSITGNVKKAQGRLVASIAAAFSAGGGFTDGALGSGSAAGAGVVFQRGACTNAKRVRSVFVSHLAFRGDRHAKTGGNFTLDVARDANGTITGASAVFYVNYRFGAPVTITGLALHQGGKGSTGPVVLDSGVGTVVDADGSGNLTERVGVDGSLASAVLANPRGYYVELTTADGSLRAQLSGFSRR